MGGTKTLKDRRALSMPDVPFSAYCRDCWEPVYSLWIDNEPHDGRCHGMGPCSRKPQKPVGAA